MRTSVFRPLFEPLFNDPFNDPFFTSNQLFKPQTSSLGALDIHETDKQYLVSLDLPGLSRQDVKVFIKDDILNVEGERKDEHEDLDSSGRKVSEKSFGSFARRIQLPKDVVQENVEASMQDGVLKLKFEKHVDPTEGKKEIEIN